MLSTLSNKHCKTDLTSGLDCLFHEICDLVEVHGYVGLWHVGQLEPLVLDAERPVELLVRVDSPDHAPLGRVEHVRHAQLLQVERVPCCRPVLKCANHPLMT